MHYKDDAFFKSKPFDTTMINTTPKVSIIIPNYNHAHFLVQRLESVFNQTYENVEIILLDDASTDHSLNILEDYKFHSKITHLIVNPRNSGSPFKQWEKGLQYATGEYIWIAESDDYAEYSFLERLVEAIDSEDIGIIYAQSVDIDERGNIIGDRLKYTSIFKPNIWTNDFLMDGKIFVERYMSLKNVIPNVSAVLIKRSALVKHFNNDLPFSLALDWMTWVSILGEYNVKFLPQRLNYFRQREESITSRLNKSSAANYEATKIFLHIRNEFLIKSRTFKCNTRRRLFYWALSYGKLSRSSYDRLTIENIWKLDAIYLILILPVCLTSSIRYIVK